MRRGLWGLATGVVVASVLALTACAPAPLLESESDRLQVVTSTGLLRDLVENVGGDRVDVLSIVPAGSDPHSFEPSLRDARNVVYADVAFTNYALLEEHAIIRTIDANLADDALNVSLAEESVKYSAELIPLVENLNLDTIWLGLRALGSGEEYGANRTSQVRVSAVGASGPGDITAYLTGTFGQTEVYFDSADGFDSDDGYRHDSVSLPPDAHTHLSWSFSEPGVYTLDFEASLQVDDTSRPERIGAATFTFAVGVSPASGDLGDRFPLDRAHADFAVDLNSREFVARYDEEGGGTHTQRSYAPDEVVIVVPPRALDEIPDGDQYRFLGRPGTQIYQLPQAVLGKHVHGEIDPHLWQDVRNAMAYVQLIRDTLIDADPKGALEYQRNASRYLDELQATDDYLRGTIAEIPKQRRHLVTTHDAFGYLANAYDLEVAGFVTPNPATEPSLADRRKLTETLRVLEIPAVFLEPNLAARASTLTEVAGELGVEVCTIYGDSFDDRVADYVSMMRFNADSLLRCLA